MFRRLWALFRREIVASRGTMLLIAAFIGGWDLFLLTRVGKWSTEIPIMLSLWPVFIVMPWTLLGAFQSWHREWQHGSAHYTLAFPVPGWALVLAKGVAALVETAFLGLVAVVAGWPLYGPALFTEMQGLGAGLFWRIALTDILRLGLVTAALLFVVAVIVQWAYLMGRLVRKLPGLFVPLAGLAGLWILLRGSGLLNLALKWVPPMALIAPAKDGRVFVISEQLVGLAPVLSALMIGCAFFAITGWLAERQVDV